MRERLLVHLRSLPQIVESWNRPEDSDPQPSQFARSLTKVATILNWLVCHSTNSRLIFSSILQLAYSKFLSRSIVPASWFISSQEVGFLQRVLSRTLHDVDVQAIFRWDLFPLFTKLLSRLSIWLNSNLIELFCIYTSEFLWRRRKTNKLAWFVKFSFVSVDHFLDSDNLNPNRRSFDFQVKNG